MKNFMIALLAVATIGWYAQAADAAPHGYHSAGHHHDGYHAPRRSYSHHDDHHWSHGHGDYYRPYYRPPVRRYYVEPVPVQPYYVAPVPASGIELYGKRGGISLFW